MDLLKELEQRGAVLLDHHFVYKSGKHGPHYINMDPAFPEVGFMTKVCEELAEPFWGSRVQVVVGAATGGIPLAALTAASSMPGSPSRFAPAYAWADKDGDNFVFERGGFAERLYNKRVLVVEDLLNTGDTVKKVIAQVQKHGGLVIGVSVICNRGSETAESLIVPRLEQLSAVDFQAYDSWSCPLCLQGVPIVSDIGHGKEYQELNGGYSGGFVTVLS